MVKRVVIVGGGAGGITCAVRVRRLDENCEIIVLEKTNNISVANCGFPYYFEGVVTERKQLIIRTPQFLSTRFNLDIRTDSEVVNINRELKSVTVKTQNKNNNEEEFYDLSYEKLVVSVGSAPIHPMIEGIDSTSHIHYLRSLQDSDQLKVDVEQLKSRKENGRIAMIGGGYIGMELSEAMIALGMKVTLLEAGKHVMSLLDEEMAAPIHNVLRSKGIDLRLSSSAVKLSNNENDEVVVKLASGEEVISDFVVIAVGAKANSTICEKAGLVTGNRGAVRVDHQMRSSDPDIYCLGDQIELPHLISGDFVNIQLAGPANRQAHTAADSLLGRQSHYSGCQGTAICQIFELTVALTGVSEKEIRRSNNGEIKNYRKIYANLANQVHYFPKSSPIFIKLIFDATTGRIFGSQMIGTNGVDKRIDVLAVAVRKAMTVFDLEDLELAYAPPYNGPVDPINNIGHIGANILRGDVDIWYFDEKIDLEKQMPLDVRTVEENNKGAIPNSLLIPLDNLRNSIDKIDKSKEILVYCQSGLRGYVATRLLMDHGFSCRNLTGGYMVYNNWKIVN